MELTTGLLATAGYLALLALAIRYAIRDRRRRKRVDAQREVLGAPGRPTGEGAAEERAEEAGCGCVGCIVLIVGILVLGGVIGLLLFGWRQLLG